MKIECRHCEALNDIDSEKCWKCKTPIPEEERERCKILAAEKADREEAERIEAEERKRADTMRSLIEQERRRKERGGKEYKVLTQKDKFFSGKFDPETLEAAINAYSEQGWKVVSMATASMPGFGGSRDEIIILFERDVK